MPHHAHAKQTAPQEPPKPYPPSLRPKHTAPPPFSRIQYPRHSRERDHLRHEAVVP